MCPIFWIVCAGSFPQKMPPDPAFNCFRGAKKTATTPDQWHSSHKAGRTRWGDRHASCLSGWGFSGLEWLPVGLTCAVTAVTLIICAKIPRCPHEMPSMSGFYRHIIYHSISEVGYTRTLLFVYVLYHQWVYILSRKWVGLLRNNQVLRASISTICLCLSHNLNSGLAKFPGWSTCDTSASDKTS